MAITYQGAGTLTTGGQTSIAVPYPATSISAGDLLIIIVGCHPNTPTFDAVTGWTTFGQLAGGNNVAAAADVGQSRISGYWKEAVGGETGSVTVTLTGATSGAAGTSVYGIMLHYKKDNIGSWNLNQTTGADATTGTSWNIAFGVNPVLTANDVIVCASAISTDTIPTFASETVSATGATIAAPTVIGNASAVTGLDIGGHIIRSTVTAGTSTAAPSWTATLSGTTTNYSGPGILIRVREPAPSTIVTVNQVTETNTAQPITSNKIYAVGQVTETDTAQIITPSLGAGPTVVAVNQVVETDTAQPITRDKIKTIGQVIETDTPQAITRQKLKSVIQVTETDTAQIITKISAGRFVNQVTETDTAQPITRSKIKTIGQVIETDSTQPIKYIHQRTLGQVIETDTVTSITKRKIKTVGQTLETDTANKINILGRVSQVVETDIAQPIRAISIKTLGQVLETDTVQNIRVAKQRTIQQVIETDSVTLVQRLKRITLGQPVETEFANAIINKLPDPRIPDVTVLVSRDTVDSVSQVYTVDSVSQVYTVDVKLVRSEVNVPIIHPSIDVVVD